MQIENQFELLRSIHQLDVEESRRFLIGFFNGFWMSAFVSALAYLAARNIWGNLL